MKYKKYHIRLVISMILIIVFNLYFSTVYNIVEYATNPNTPTPPPFETLITNITNDLKAIKNFISPSNETIFNNFIILNSSIFSDIKQHIMAIAIFQEKLLFDQELVNDYNLKELEKDNYPPVVKEYISITESISNILTDLLKNYTVYKQDINLISNNYFNKNKTDYTFSNDFENIYSNLDTELDNFRTFFYKNGSENYKAMNSDYAIDSDFFIIAATILIELVELQKLNEKSAKLVNDFRTNMFTLVGNIQYKDNIYTFIDNNVNQTDMPIYAEINKSDIINLINNNPEEFPNFVKQETLNEELDKLVKLDEFNNLVDDRLKLMQKRAAKGYNSY